MGKRYWYEDDDNWLDKYDSDSDDENSDGDECDNESYEPLTGWDLGLPPVGTTIRMGV